MLPYTLSLKAFRMIVRIHAHQYRSIDSKKTIQLMTHSNMVEQLMGDFFNIDQVPQIPKIAKK